MPIENDRGNVWVEFRRRKHRPIRYIPLEKAVKLWPKCPRRIRIFHLDPRVATQSPGSKPEQS